ncbi:MAG TPA: amino acid adenylation domain-containing protein, partial [Thermoanaerobaculia bacterium]|nr:amino acid adenylation domain-containing protein [Thermoanaerobaculia bacterium]
RPVQVVLPAAPFAVPVVDLTGLAAARRAESLTVLAAADARRLFDLARGPLFRVTLLLLAPAGALSRAESVLLVNMHHIISDGWSLGIFLRELAALYAAAREGRPSPLPELPIQGADHAAWQRARLSGGTLEREIAWWRERLAGAPTVLELPTDRPRPQLQRFRGGHHPFALPALLAAEVQAFGRQAGATLFMTLLAAFQGLLARYTGQRDLLVGSPVAGRNHREIEGLIGFFVNTLVLRLDLAGQPGFRTLVDRARGAALGAYDHQELPFEKLVLALRPERDLSRAPFFQVLFALQNAPLGKLELPGLALDLLPVESGIAKFDLTLGMREAGERLAGVVEYDRDLFEAVTAARLAAHFTNLLAAAVAEPELALSELPLLSAAERQQAQVEWNDPWIDYPEDGLLPERIAAVAARRPDAVALCGVGERVSYGELAARAGRIGRHLRALGVGPDDRVGIAVERSPAMVAALLAVWEAGGAYLPLDLSLPAERLAFMLTDARVRLVLAESRTTGALPALGVPLVAVEDLQAAEPRGPLSKAPPLLLAQAAYVIYTSGSTGRPKGVAVSHAALGNRMRFVAAAEVTAGDWFLHKTTLLFDASVGELFSPLVAGATMLLVPRGEERDPARLVELIERFGVTLASFTPSLLAALLQARSLVRCHSLRVVLTGGEVVSPELAALFYRQSSADLYNRYGPTETTISVLSWRCARGDSGGALPIGRPIAHTAVHVLDANGAPLAAGVAGELCLGGPCLARGYHDRPALTAEKFVPNPFVALPGERLYRTGDLVRWRADGAVVFLGRIDSQVKIRGFRVELGEIEVALREHPAVGKAAVIDRADPATGSRRLVAYVVPRPGRPAALAAPLVPSELMEYLGQKLPAHMVPAAWVVLSELPLSPTGKVDRKGLPEPAAEARREGDLEAPRGLVEELVAEIWTDLLGLRQVGREDGFFDLGGHSLLATQVVSRVREALKVEVPLRRLFEAPTLAGFAAAVAAAGREGEPAPRAGIRPLPGPRRAFPLSFAQERLWFLDQLQPGSALYNIAGGVRFHGGRNAGLDPGVLRASLAWIADRHEALRTTFTATPEGPVQEIAPALAPALPEVDLRGLGAIAGRRRAEAELARLGGEEVRRPFDLAAGPLLRVTLVRLGEGDDATLFTQHHIVSDGWSMGVFIRELTTAYGRIAGGAAGGLPALPPLAVQYADFAAWQREWLSGAVLDGQLAWWRQRLAGAPTVLELPADRPRPLSPMSSTSSTSPSFRGGQVRFRLPAELSTVLGRLGRRRTATPFMVLLAGFQVLLARATGQEDLLVGAPVANRTRREIEGLIGFFVNTLVLRGELAGAPRFGDLLDQARDMSLGAYAHQDLPFERLVEELQPVRDLALSPLFQVTLVLQNAPTASLALPGLVVEPLAADAAVAPFDLQLFFQDAGGELAGTLVYAADRFDRATALRWASQLSTLLADAVADPGKRCAELALLGPAERHQLLAEWNDTTAGGRDAPPAPVLALFAAEAGRIPDRVAVIYEGESVTYGELDRRATRLARRLVAVGVGPETPVGVCLPRSPDLVAALLAVWQAGGAYLPLDPTYPRERLALLLADSGARAVLTLAWLASSLPEGSTLLKLDDPVPVPLADPELPPLAGPKRLAYIIYTSGSTGLPKGVLVEHGNLANLVAAAQRELGWGDGEVMPCVAPFSFDIFFFELLGPLLAGGTVLLLPLAPVLDVPALVALLPRVTRLHAVPALMRQIAERVVDGRTSCPGLRTVLVGGDVVPAELLADLRRAFPGAELRVLYGPTEGTVLGSIWRVPERAESPARPERALLGRPLAGVTLVPRDPAGNPVPIGIPGEIWVGGAGVARGYLHREELTASAFPRLAGERYYRTGDLARRLPDGNLEFLGRGDRQVKIRGFRIELGEVEAALTHHPAVREAAVLAREDRPGDRRLVAYLVGTGEGDPPPAAGELRAFLKD